MAIVKMSRFQLTLFSTDKERLLHRLQAFEDVHVVDLSAGEEEERAKLHTVTLAKERTETMERMTRLEEAIKALKPYAAAPKSFVEKYSSALPERVVAMSLPGEAAAASGLWEREAGAVAAKVFETRDGIRVAEERRKSLIEKNRELEHWKNLDVTMEEMAAPKSVETKIGTIPQRWADEVRRYIATETKGTYAEFLSGDPQTHYVFLMTDGSDEGLNEFLRDINFQPVHFDRNGTVEEQLAELKNEKILQEKQIADGKLEMQKLSAEQTETLGLAYEEEADKLARIEAQEKLLASQYLTFMEGFVPTEKEGEFRQVVAATLDQQRVSLDIAPADVDDPTVPIRLKNNKLIEPFEPIVQTYSLPLYKEMDPTGLLAPWYTLFFAIMLGDLGYGALLFIGTTLALKFLKFQPGMQKSLRFFQVLSVPTMIAGVCFGSVFGGLIPMKPLILDPTQDYMTMIVFSVALGFVHILVGLLLKAVQLGREGDKPAIVYDVVSWMLILLGLVLVALTTLLKLPAIGKTIGFVMAIVGAVLVLLFSARDEKGIGRFAWGLYNLYGATSYIGDIVSYTRLTAIMLSGAYIGFSMNLIGKMLTGIGIPGYVPAAVVLVGAHLFNLFLSSLSAYVHSMRLIYVEFFGKFYEGGGKPFRGLRPEPKYINVKTEKEMN